MAACASRRALGFGLTNPEGYIQMATQRRTPTLDEFVKAKKKEKCKVCKLPVEVRGQLGRPASEKHISREQQIEWIALVTGVKITLEELQAHVTGRHDAA